MLSSVMAPSEDKVDETVAVWQTVLRGLDLRQVLISLALVVGSLIVMKIFLALLDRTLRRLEVERSLRNFVRSVLRVLLWLITLCVVLGYNGVPMTSLVAVLSVIGLAVSLALQGTLTNLAGGIMLLVSKPFKADDYVEAGGVGGVVVEVGLVYTKMCTYDKKVISVPNGQISAEKIINYSTEPQRRVDISFRLTRDSRPETVSAILLAVAGAHPKALLSPAPFARMTAQLDSSVEYTVRVWCDTEDFWDLYYDLLEQLTAALEQAGVALAYPRMDVRMSGQ